MADRVNYTVIDAHQHYWDPQRFEYLWMGPKVQPLQRAFMPEDLRPHLQKVGVHKTIVVQAISSLEEARWLLELAEENDFIAGVVTWCDLTSPTLSEVLEALQRHPKFKGVRHQIEDEADDRWMLRKDVLTGLGELERRDIPYDMLVRPRHLQHVPEVRERCPRLRMVVDHIAKPRISEQQFEPWAGDLARIAQLPDVWCKLSGMNTEANWKSWKAQDLVPYVKHVVEHFGYDRVMFGSDWPVCILAGSYEQTTYALRRALGVLPVSKARKVWGENAAEFYRAA